MRSPPSTRHSDQPNRKSHLGQVQHIAMHVRFPQRRRHSRTQLRRGVHIHFPHCPDHHRCVPALGSNGQLSCPGKDRLTRSPPETYPRAATVLATGRHRKPGQTRSANLAVPCGSGFGDAEVPGPTALVPAIQRQFRPHGLAPKVTVHTPGGGQLVHQPPPVCPACGNTAAAARRPRPRRATPDPH